MSVRCFPLPVVVPHPGFGGAGPSKDRLKYRSIGFPFRTADDQADIAAEDDLHCAIPQGHDMTAGSGDLFVGDVPGAALVGFGLEHITGRVDQFVAALQVKPYPAGKSSRTLLDLISRRPTRIPRRSRTHRKTYHRSRLASRSSRRIAHMLCRVA